MWLIAALLAIIDEPSPGHALLRLIGAICVILLLLLLSNKVLLFPLLCAFLTVAALHLLSFYLLRKRGVGVPIYQRTPPPPPSEEEEEE